MLAMTDRMADGAGRPSERAHDAGGDGPALGSGGGCRRSGSRAWCWAVAWRGLELVSRELGVTAAELTAWCDAFLAAGEAVLKTRPAEDRDAEIDRLRARSVT